MDVQAQTSRGSQNKTYKRVDFHLWCSFYYHSPCTNLRNNSSASMGRYEGTSWPAPCTVTNRNEARDSVPRSKVVTKPAVWPFTFRDATRPWQQYRHPNPKSIPVYPQSNRSSRHHQRILTYSNHGYHPDQAGPILCTVE